MDIYRHGSEEDKIEKDIEKAIFWLNILIKNDEVVEIEALLYWLSSPNKLLRKT